MSDVLRRADIMQKGKNQGQQRYNSISAIDNGGFDGGKAIKDNLQLDLNQNDYDPNFNATHQSLIVKRKGRAKDKESKNSMRMTTTSFDNFRYGMLGGAKTTSVASVMQEVVPKIGLKKSILAKDPYNILQ